jgi:hypothetical protein
MFLPLVRSDFSRGYEAVFHHTSSRSFLWCFNGPGEFRVEALKEGSHHADVLYPPEGFYAG